MAPKARQAKSKARLGAYDKMLNEEQREREEKLEIFIPNGPRLGNKVINAEGVAKAFGDRVLFEDLNFMLPPNGIVGVIGPNGAGKTTLFRMIMGMEKADKGTFSVGETVKVGYVDQVHSNIDPEKTVFETISNGTEYIRVGGREINARAYLSRFNFTGSDQEKKCGVLSGGDRNPALANEYDSQREYVTRTFNTVYGQYEFIKDLKFKTTFSYDYITTKGKDWADPRTSNGDDINGGMSKKFYERRKMVWGNQLTYNKTFAEVHHLDGLLGYEIDDQYRDYLSGYATNFATPDKNDISNGKKTESVGGSDTRTRMVSYIGRVNYDFDNKYFLGASYRVDGSSRLQRSHRWGNFWSVSGAWRIIEEDFMKPTAGWLTDMKIRASYGVNGTLPSDYYGYLALSSLGDGYNEQPAIIISQLANDRLKWETNYNLNLGLDFSLFNRVNVTLEYYLRNTKNLLMDSPVSMTTGFSSYLMNVGQLRNQGIELEINSTNIKTKDLEWKTTFNLSHNKNKVIKLDGDQTQIVSGTQIRKIGHSYRTFYMIEFAGINPENGNPQFYTNELLDDGTYSKEITEDATKARAIMLKKHAEPNVTGGLYNSIRYKWFDLSFLFNYQFGAYAYDTWAQKTEHGGYDMEANIPTYYADSWKKPGDITKYEQFYEKSSKVAMHKITNSRRLHSTDYIRLRVFSH